VWLLDPSTDRLGPDDARSLVPFEAPTAPFAFKPDPDLEKRLKKGSKDQREKAAAELAAAEKAAKSKARKKEAKKAEARAGRGVPPPHTLVLDVAPSEDDDGEVVAALDVAVVLKAPLTDGGSAPALLASDSAPPSQRWFLDPATGALVASLDGGGFCLGLQSTGRIFPSVNSPVVLVPRDSKRALRWELLPPLGKATAPARPKEQPADDEDHSTLL
jgi:hypothetical protein